jgi:hypothetical protein
MIRKFLGAALAVGASGCFGLYVELGAATTPGLKFHESAPSPGVAPPAGDKISGASGVSLNVGFELDSGRKHRVGIGYDVGSTSYDGGSAKSQLGNIRWDFTLASISNDVKLRGSVGAGSGRGTATVTATDGSVLSRTNDSSVYDVFAGVGAAWFLGSHAVVYGAVGPRYFYEPVSGGTVGGVGAALKIGVSWIFGNTVPDTSFFVPLDDATDITPSLDAGAKALGCASSRVKNDDRTYAFVTAKCGEGNIKYFQIAQGIEITCVHTFESDCQALNHRVLESTKAVLAARRKADAPSTPPPPATTTPKPAPTSPAPTPPSSAAPDPTPSAPPAPSPATSH